MDQQHIREEKIIDYVLNQLPLKEHFQVHSHITSCAQCAHEYAYWEKQLQVTSAPTPSPQLKHRLMKQIDKERESPMLKKGMIGLCLCLAFAICFILLIEWPTSSHLALDDSKHSDGVSLMNEESSRNDLETNFVNKAWLNSQQMKPLLFYQHEPNLTVNDFFETMSHEVLANETFSLNDEWLCSLNLKQNELICVHFQYDNETNQWVPINAKKFPQYLRWE